MTVAGDTKWRNFWPIAEFLPVLTTLATLLTPALHALQNPTPFGNIVLGWVCAIATSLAIATFFFSLWMIVVLHSPRTNKLNLLIPSPSKVTRILAYTAFVAVILGIGSIAVSLQ